MICVVSVFIAFQYRYVICDMCCECIYCVSVQVCGMCMCECIYCVSVQVCGMCMCECIYCISGVGIYLQVQ